ncbi:PfkB family carbohydrate kinase [Actinokineospora guangxiensis]|uniref:PfkB family carbohydrate kinase n=1 Tax=Actinokineospora guangxiensis TaxID=1490288 RepID=A0ABW0EVY3_9PSEU
MTATARRRARICRDRYLSGFGGDLDITVVGHIARDVVLGIDAVPGPRGSTEVRERRELLGGKGANQAVACAQLGASVALLGVVGDDEVGTRLLAQARADRVDVACAVRRPGARTALIVNVVEAGGDWRYFEDLAGADLTAADIENARGTLLAATSVLVQLQQPAARVAATLAHAAGRRVVLDGVPPADDRADLLAAADVLRADAHEGGLITGVELTTVEAATGAARELLREGPSLVALGVDGEGDVVAWSDGEVFLPFSGDPVADTTGAGDAFTAAFTVTLTVTLTRGGSPEEAARAAAAAAGSTVRRLGGRPALGP